MLGFFLITVKNQQEKKKKTFVCVHGSDNKKEAALFVGMYSHKTYRCMCICKDDKHRERTKEKEREKKIK